MAPAGILGMSFDIWRWWIGGGDFTTIHILVFGKGRGLDRQPLSKPDSDNGLVQAFHRPFPTSITALSIGNSIDTISFDAHTFTDKIYGVGV